MVERHNVEGKIMLKLSRQERNELDTYTKDLRRLMTSIEELASQFNEKAAAVNQIIEEAADRVEGEISEKSERWQESDRGEAVADWVSAMRDVTVMDVDTTEAEAALEQLEAMEYSPQPE